MSDHPVLHDDFIEIVLEGPQTEANVRQLMKLDDAVIDKFVRSGKPLRILVDLSQLTSVGLSGFTAAAKNMEDRKVDYQRVALYGIHLDIVKELAELFMKMFGDSDKMKIFDTREQALAWLHRPAAK